MTEMFLPALWAAIIIEIATDELQMVMMVSPFLMRFWPICPIRLAASFEWDMNSSACFMTVSDASATVVFGYLLTIRTAFGRDTAVGRVDTSVVAAQSIFCWNSSIVI